MPYCVWNWSKSGMCGMVVCKPILVLSLAQAEQYAAHQKVGKQAGAELGQAQYEIG